MWRKAGTPGWKRLAMIGLVATAGIVVYRNPKYRDRLKGLASAAMGRFRGGSLDDVGLADRIRSEALGSHPTARVNVSVHNRVATLRGDVTSIEEISEIEQAVRKVSGIVEVQNYLQQPGAEPQSQAASQATQVDSQASEAAGLQSHGPSQAGEIAGHTAEEGGRAESQPGGAAQPEPPAEGGTGSDASHSSSSPDS